MCDLPDAALIGAAIRHEWDLDPGFLTVNHGSFGATPRMVLAEAEAWRRRMEAQPTRFMAALPAALRAAAGAVARFIGASADDVVFVDNATTGCNAVLRSLRFVAGDEILVLDHGYGAVTKAARYVAERSGARVIEAPVPFPRCDDDEVVANLAAALTPRTRLAVLDHITSASALTLPLARMAATCHGAGVAVLADGAHAPGNIDLDVPALGVDWYAGNCHKWLCAPKGSGFLWAHPDRQHDLHPVTISHGYGAGFLAEFDWTGTRDPSAWLAVPAALAFHERLGGAALRARNRALAAEAAALIAGRLGTETAHGNAEGNAMALVRLDLPGTATEAGVLALRHRLLAAGTDSPVYLVAGAAWARISAAPYNELADFARLASVLQRKAAEHLT